LCESINVVINAGTNNWNGCGGWLACEVSYFIDGIRIKVIKLKLVIEPTIPDVFMLLS